MNSRDGAVSVCVCVTVVLPVDECVCVCVYVKLHEPLEENKEEEKQLKAE